MNFKKLLLTSTACLALVATLSSCGGGSVQLTYTDASGNVVTQNVAPTKETEDVVKSLDSIVLKDYQVSTSDVYSLKASADLTVKGTVDSKTIDGKAKASLTVAGSVPTITETSTLESVIKATSGYVGLSAEISGFGALSQTTSTTTSVSDLNKAEVECFLEQGNLYVDVQELALPILDSVAGLGGSGMASQMLPMIQTIIPSLKGKTLSIDYATVISLLSFAGLDASDTSAIDAQIQKLAKEQKDGKLTISPMTVLGQKVTREQLETSIKKFVEDYKVEISAVSGSNVTFKMSYDLATIKGTTTTTSNDKSPSGVAELEVTVNVVDLSYVGVKATAKEINVPADNGTIKINGTVELKVEKGGEIKKISDSKKTAAKPLMTLITEIMTQAMGGQQ